ncbi:hypothetical protein FRB98_006554 [Tulasnella sp. 332]|nr:hypothetical protein FRB98_006554 [Tulasnella sp. 332]
MSEQLSRFRILIVGRGNAGKTTILQKLCSETDTPIVRDQNGHLRGVHNIEHEITYPSSPLFVFHDSSGLESGSDTELQTIAQFISRRAATTQLPDGLHVVWICIPLDDERPSMRLFDLNTGDVAAVFIFTKYDGLQAKTFGTLRRQGLSRLAALGAASEQAERVFQQEWIPLLKAPSPPPPPPAFVRLKDLHKPEGSCDDLTQCTSDILDDNKPLQRMFIMAQKYRLQLRVQCLVPGSIEHLLKNASGNKIRHELVQIVLSWMPHVYYANKQVSAVVCPKETLAVTCLLGSTVYHPDSAGARIKRLSLWSGHSKHYGDLVRRFMEAVHYTGPTKLFPSQDLLQTIAGCAIVADHCFWMTERTDNVKLLPIPKENLEIGLQTALQAYKSHHQSIVDAVVEAFPEKDTLSVPLMERITLKPKDPRVKELSGKLIRLVLTHHMPRKLPPASGEGSQIVPIE